MELIWYERPGDLFRADNFGSVIPMTTMTLEQKLNASMRLSIYYAAALLLLKRDATYALIPVLAAGVTFCLYSSQASRRIERMGQMSADRVAKGDGLLSGACTTPTKHNPFMNVNHTESPLRPPACDAMDPRVEQEVQELFSDNLYRDIDDVWGQKTKTRQFITNPTTSVPNDQEAFGEWLYGDMRHNGKRTRPPANSVM